MLEVRIVLGNIVLGSCAIERIIYRYKFQRKTIAFKNALKLVNTYRRVISCKHKTQPKNCFF